MKKLYFVFVFLFPIFLQAQVKVDASQFARKKSVQLATSQEQIDISWPAGPQKMGRLVLDLRKEEPVIKLIGLSENGVFIPVKESLDPAFILTIGKRDLVSQNGWNIFFDKTSKLPSTSHKIAFDKQSAQVKTVGSRTVITIGKLYASHFEGVLEFTLYNGSPMINVAAVMTTEVDSVAILYDAGLVCRNEIWKNIHWSDTQDKLQTRVSGQNDTSTNIPVKYRTIVGEGKQGSLALFPAPHQYFYPLDEAYNLKHIWAGSNYRKMIDGYGFGIRQDPAGDNRWVPWFNAPPKTKQRLNFFCLLSAGDASAALAEVKKLTNNDKYAKLDGYKTMSSHFHNEFVVKVIVGNRPLPDTPSFKKVFKDLGVDIVHLGEFHYTAHPKGPDELRLLELKYLFDMCSKYSDNEFLLLPGEEPNEFLGGHWLQIFPNPVYWIMSRNNNKPFVSEHPQYGKVYRIGNKEEMLKLLEQEKGLAWTAHARTKGSTGYPDKYKEEEFFKSDRFFGAAWKAMPADLSTDRLGRRVLDLMDDMANWGYPKYAIAEADLFTIEPENEMYAHMNVNYLRMSELPRYSDGWQPVVDAMSSGNFFASTGEVLIPEFRAGDTRTGDTLQVPKNGRVKIDFDVQWTFPLAFAELITGDGKNVYRERIDLANTEAYGRKSFRHEMNLTGKKWVRLEVWDAAVNGAFTQFIWLNQNEPVSK